ncbi:hypothetical protein ACVWWQ_000792 [Rhodanobacter sp. TND4EL1]
MSGVKSQTKAAKSRPLIKLKPKLKTKGSAVDATTAAWVKQAESLSKAFASRYKVLIHSTDRQLSASFEIGCFHALLQYYEIQGYKIKPENLIDGNYRYLTTPSGNPDNFSHVALKGLDGEFELRQQVRIESHVDPEICFTPDLLVLTKNASVGAQKRLDFAGGKRSFFKVSSVDVVAAHECKSTNPFPELLVSFIGMLVAAHAWYPSGGHAVLTKGSGHMAPTLFVGGTAKPLYLKMIRAMQKCYGMNIVCGLHEGTWDLKGADNRLTWS